MSWGKQGKVKNFYCSKKKENYKIDKDGNE